MSERITLAWAQAAASLIVEEGRTDWTQARRKASEQLGLTRAEQSFSPSDEELITAIREHHAIFAPEEQAAQLREQREFALLWMQRLRDFSPRLSGPVAEGWAHAASRIVIELKNIDEKDLAILLLNKAVDFEPVGAQKSTGEFDLTTDIPVRLRVLQPGKPRQHAQQLRLSITELEALLV
jgi:hypothetical protein